MGGPGGGGRHGHPWTPSAPAWGFCRWPRLHANSNTTHPNGCQRYRRCHGPTIDARSICRQATKATEITFNITLWCYQKLGEDRTDLHNFILSCPTHQHLVGSPATATLTLNKMAPDKMPAHAQPRKQKPRIPADSDHCQTTPHALLYSRTPRKHGPL